MKELIRHILREHTREIGEDRGPKSTKESFITRAKEIHGDKYDYSKIKYINTKTPISILCPIHGKFVQAPYVHLRGSGCPECGKEIRSEKRRDSVETFINKAKEVHGNKYDYSKVIYRNNDTKITIICPIHGEFNQMPGAHLNGQGCPTCGKNAQRFSKEDFIKKAEEIHGNKYDYSKVNYINNRIPVTITCPEHGDFQQAPGNHMSGQKCNRCAGREMVNQEDFIKLAKKIHGDKYDYSKVKYVAAKLPVKIICPLHGEFMQKPGDHVKQGSECPICGIIKRNKSLESNTDEFIEKAKKVYGNKYDYSLVDYKNSKTPVIIKCKKHGNFEIEPNKHLSGRGCQVCGLESRIKLKTKSVDNFLELSKKVHGNKYDYSKIDYKNRVTPVEIVCSKHGSFLQSPSNHITGQGCPTCSESKGEILVNSILNSYKIKSVRQHKFIDCTNKLKGGSCRKLPFDFYLPKMNVAIEYDGQQHHVPVWGEEGFEKVKRNDKIKNQYCKKNGIKLIRIPYTMKKEEIEPYILKELGIK